MPLRLQNPNAAAKEKADKEAKEKADKEAKEKADKEKTEAQSVPAATLKDLAVGEPAEGAVQLPEPPVDEVEVIPVAPSPHHVWIPGYWHWDFPTNVYLWQDGMWIDKTDFPHVAPLPEPFEAIGRAPGAGFFFAPGFWAWDGVDYAWLPGRWARHREGFFWVHPFYESIGGHWESRGWGFEKHDAAWDHAHEGWDHHGDLWCHPGYFHDREEYAKAHVAEVKARIEDAKRKPGAPEKLPEKHDKEKKVPAKHDHPHEKNDKKK